MCGIAGIVNRKERPFDFSTFCMLGIENDARGGDSCGVFIDGQYEYGVGENKLFGDYFQDSNLIYDTEKATVALLHCRRASVGKISKETAQPVIIKKNGKIEFVVMHNGTIHNYEALAKKYIPDVNITGMTDSQVMAHIFYYKGYDVLSEYNGGAAFCIVDYRGKKPCTMLFRGQSKKTENAKNEEEERPLFYCIDSKKEELVFCSIYLPLVALRKDAKIYMPRANCLIEFEGSRMKLIKEYPRTKCFQNKVYNRTTPCRDFSNWYGYTSAYLTVNFDNNKYYHGGKPLNGTYYINDWGRICNEKDPGEAIEVTFFQGVLLRHPNCLKIINKLRRKFNLSEEEFYSKYENMVRYLSYDRVFYNKEDKKYYEATSLVSNRLFTGELHPITVLTVIKVSNGSRVCTTYGRDRKTSLEEFSKTKNDFNFKSILRECRSLMK